MVIINKLYWNINLKLAYHLLSDFQTVYRFFVETICYARVIKRETKVGARFFFYIENIARLRGGQMHLVRRTVQNEREREAGRGREQAAAWHRPFKKAHPRICCRAELSRRRARERRARRPTKPSTRKRYFLCSFHQRHRAEKMRGPMWLRARCVSQLAPVCAKYKFV